LVFDNCEHVRDAAADLVEAILTHSSTVKILATSREGLGIADERLWVVPSLDVGAGVDSAAVSLFVERAQSVSSRFSAARPDEAAAIVEVCRRVDGIPLAIELAASRMASMTAIEVRDRLHQRFRLLVGSRRGLERHQTLRQAVAWSYDLLDDAERALLQRCSVFAGGFDLESACAITGFPDAPDDLAVLDLLDALVRKSLLVADRSAGRTRYSMLETIRQFAEEQLAASGASTEVRSAHARYFAGREADVMALWDSPRQREAYAWFAAEIPNLRTAFRWAADSGDLDTAATVATYATLLGYMAENFEAVAWAEELIEAARTVDHPRLAHLYVMASTCYNAGRVEDAVRYSDAGQKMIESGRYAVPFGIEGMLGTPWIVIGQSQRWVDLCRAEVARGRDTHTLSWACLVFALVIVGRADEAMAAVDGLVDAAEITHNPGAHSFALLAEGLAFRGADPMRALDALRRGLVIAQESGNRLNESHCANVLSELETEHGDPHTALDYLTLSIRNYHDSGNTAMVRSPLSLLAVLFHRLGRHEPAAAVAGFAINPLAAAAFPEINVVIAQLREVLGAETYESLARKGEAMTTSAMVAFAYDEIDQARAALNAVAK
jgi:predicted ATPase